MSFRIRRRAVDAWWPNLELSVLLFLFLPFVFHSSPQVPDVDGLLLSRILWGKGEASCCQRSVENRALNLLAPE